MPIEWNSLILGGNELKTAGPVSENARRAKDVILTGPGSVWSGDVVILSRPVQ